VMRENTPSKTGVATGNSFSRPLPLCFHTQMSPHFLKSYFYSSSGGQSS
jgi:hypothetical protein